MRTWLLVLVSLAKIASAQTSPSTSPKFVWEGDVDESAILYLRGDHLEVENPRGERVEHQRYRFFHLPPDSHETVRLEVSEGRGSVAITQQPTLENDYTIIVDIQDRQEGRGHYSIALYWDASGDDRQGGGKRWRDRGWQGDGIVETRGAPGRLTWHGHVDSQAVVECRDSSCHSLTHTGMPVSHEKVHFDKPLPKAEVLVTLGPDDANGSIRVSQQPLRSNDYAVRVEIADGCGARKDCSFTLSWREQGGTAEPRQAHRGAVWSGRVDGTARVTLRGSSTLSQSISGKPIADEQTDFGRDLPHSEVPAAVKLLKGRGTVVLVESPAERNGFSLVFEVRDPGPGADDYVVELDW